MTNQNYDTKEMEAHVADVFSDVKPATKHLPGYQVACKIAQAAPNSLFCFFKTYIDKDSKLVKQPLDRSGGTSVGTEAPSERLVKAHEVLDGTAPVPPAAMFWGLYLQRPLDCVHDGLMPTVLDIDCKNADPAEIDEVQQQLFDHSVGLGMLTEHSHSKTGRHIIFLSEQDDVLAAKKVATSVGHDIEIFGVVGSSGKNVMLTDTHLDGEVIRSNSTCIEFLDSVGIDGNDKSKPAQAPNRAPAAIPHRIGATSTGSTAYDVAALMVLLPILIPPQKVAAMTC